jgi:hypothetical protein
MPDEPKVETFQTPSGPVTATTQTIEPMAQKVTASSVAEVKEFERFALSAWEFVAAYLGHEATLNLATLDQAFRAWQLESSRRFSEQEVENILGAYLGQRLAADLNMEWVTVTDEYGTDYAVRSRKYEVMSFPFAVVSKRIEDGKHDFLVAVYHTVEHTLEEGDHMPRPT